MSVHNHGRALHIAVQFVFIIICCGLTLLADTKQASGLQLVDNKSMPIQEMQAIITTELIHIELQEKQIETFNKIMATMLTDTQKQKAVDARENIYSSRQYTKDLSTIIVILQQRTRALNAEIAVHNRLMGQTPSQPSGKSSNGSK